MGTGAIEAARLIDPLSGLPLVADEPWSLTDGRTRWPVVSGIPYLRVGRDSMRRAVLDALDRADDRRALALLLTDQDDYARTAPADVSSLLSLIDGVADGPISLREAMVALQFGPVADYFAYRWSSPTYLSGLALLERFGGSAAKPVVEVACGIGHYLRDLAARGRSCVGIDVVFSKLWLARTFVVPAEVTLVCGDVAAGWPLAPLSDGGDVFCHDAFYFLPQKQRLVEAWRRLVGDRGRILVGHAHNRDFDHGGVAGEPKTPGEYADLLPGCLLFDDAELAQSAWERTAVPDRSVEELGRVEAVAMAWGPAEPPSAAGWVSLLDPLPGASLRLNPILREVAGRLEPSWPSARFEAEYAAASSYLRGEPVPDRSVLDAAADGAAGSNPEVDRLARRRILLDLPERW